MALDAVLARLKMRTEETAEGCWMWLGPVDRNHHPIMHGRGGEEKEVLRLVACYKYKVSYSLTARVKPICYNPECISPDHCFLPEQEKPAPSVEPPADAPPEKKQKRPASRVSLKDEVRVRQLRKRGLSSVQIGALTRLPYRTIELILEKTG